MKMRTASGMQLKRIFIIMWLNMMKPVTGLDARHANPKRIWQCMLSITPVIQPAILVVIQER